MTSEVFYFKEDEIPDFVYGQEGLWPILRRALREGRVAKIVYLDSENDRTEREILPEVLFRAGYGVWYVAAFCHLRNEARTFQLDRIQRIELTQKKEASFGVADKIRTEGCPWSAKDFPCTLPPPPPYTDEEIKEIEEEVRCKTEKIRRESDFLQACKRNDLDALSFALDEGIDVNHGVGRTFTPLIDAARESDPETVRFLLARSADVNIRDEHGATPLIKAAQNGRLDNVKVLVEEGNADVHACDRGGWTALYAAQLCNDPKPLTEYLLAHGADINARTREGETIFMLTIAPPCYRKTPSFDFAEFLLQKGADIQTQDKKGRSALFIAAEKRLLPEIGFLLAHGLWVDLRDNFGSTALLAFLEDHRRQVFFENNYQNAVDFSVVRELVSAGSDVSAANARGITPLMLASGKMLSLLLDHGADPNAADQKGRCVAIYHANDLAALRELADHGADLTARDRDGNDVLLKSDARYPLLRYLVEEHHLPVNDRNAAGTTVLHRACESGDLRSVKYLVRHGADCHVLDAGKETPFSYVQGKSRDACEGDPFERIFQFFLDHFNVHPDEWRKEEEATGIRFKPDPEEDEDEIPY
ncbi:MAG: ankyrin repeat domain-containing protein [Victivallaceae bacterium]|nr:ankyrin repeat domain-containing protein [Victivallaceae bacterium]